MHTCSMLEHADLFGKRRLTLKLATFMQLGANLWVPELHNSVYQLDYPGVHLVCTASLPKMINTQGHQRIESELPQSHHSPSLGTCTFPHTPHQEPNVTHGFSGKNTWHVKYCQVCQSWFEEAFLVMQLVKQAEHLFAYVVKYKYLYPAKLGQELSPLLNKILNDNNNLIFLPFSNHYKYPFNSSLLNKVKVK